MQLNHFDLNLLKALDALLSERNVTRAAERLFLTQQATSGALGRLRQHFDDQLLVRVGRQMELTPLARSLVQPVRDALLQIQVALDTTPTFDPMVARRSITVAMSDYASLVVLPRLLRKLSQEAPLMTCHVEALSESSLRRLEGGDLDFCLSASDWRLYSNYEPGPGIRSQALFHDDFICVIDRNHPEVGEEMTLPLYARLPHNQVRLGQGVGSIVEQGWSLAGLRPKVVATATDFSTLIFMLPGTPLVATVQRRLAETLKGSLPLRLLECPLALERLDENMIWHARNELDPGHQFAREAFVEAAREVVNIGAD